MPAETVESIVVTASAVLPQNITIGDAHCLTDGVLTLATVNTALLAITLGQAYSIPLRIVAIR